MSRLNLRIDTLAMQTIWCVLLLAVSANGANFTVKSGGGGNYTTIQACATAMSAGDTCTVYAGTYNESPSVPAGTAGNYKTITVNGSDVVIVNGFTLNSHTKLIGNCTAPAAASSCGFTITTPSAPKSGACVGWTSSITDFYIVNNVMTECGAGGGYMVGSSYTILSSYGYIQGNTLSYACVNSNSINHSECNSIMPFGDHFLVEKNDLSHYTLSIDFGTNYSIYRNNTFHDQYETEASGNYHTDAFFSEPGAGVSYTVEYNVFEGNLQYNAVGPNSKTDLFQNDSGTTCSNCFNVIFRHNTISRIGSGAASNYYWPNIMAYNNTVVDALSDGTATNGTADYAQFSTNGSYLNQLYYFSFASGTNFNVYQCGSGCDFGHSLYWCTGSCTYVWGNVAGVPFLNDPGNKNANPMFVNYISPGNPSNNYNLQAGSPAIAAGTYLTTVASGDSGSGTSLVVTDAAYFQDGYSLSNAYSTVHPDCIAVGTASNFVCVTAVNYTTNTLTLASSISRSAGQGVYLYSKSDGVQVLTGSASDMGAYPYGSGNNPPAPPTSLSAVVN
jgi:hypothetical protein